MRKTMLLMLILLVPVLICANAILGTSLQRPRFAANILKIQLSTDAIARTNLPTEYYSEAPEFGIEELDELTASYGSHKILRAHIRMKDRAFEQRTGFDRWFLIIYDQALDIESALREFKLQSQWIEEAIPEFYAYTTAVPNDTYYANNWGHNNTAQLPVYTGGSHSGAGVGTIGFDVDAQLAWDQSQGYGSISTIIAIIDTGVDTAHPDLRLTTGYDYGDNDGNPMDDSADPGHGTACSGVAAGRANNALGVTGVAGGCTVMPLKIADSAGSLGFTAIENALTHCGNNGVDVASMSFGAEGGTAEGDSPSTDTALEYAYSHGVTLLAATANSNASTIAYPSNHNKVISVGAASPTGQRKSTTSSDGETWWGSNYGVATMNDPNAVDIMAPTILPATDITGAGGYDSGNYSMWFNGTSCATPYAAGVAALLISKDPSLTPAQVRTALTSTATDMTFDGGAGWDRYTGYGMVNANNALLSLVPGMPSCQITAPASGSVIDLGSTVTINATATDSDGTIIDVKFYIDNVLQFTDNASPYSWSWNTTAYSGGNHQIKVIATDNSSNTAQSEITVFLLAPPNEGFESGNFAAYPWVNSSSIPWTVQSIEKFSGTYAARSGAIAENGSTEISVTVNVTEAGNISFYQKVSSESSYDFLRFFIDGEQQAQWSGAGSWTQQSYPVNTGAHTFMWRFIKDNSVSSGSDCAWIDHIIFPPTGTGYMPPAIELSTHALENSMLPEELDSQSFTIGNSGSRDLNYSMSLQEVIRLDSAVRTSRDRNITGSTLELDSDSYNAGSTVEWTFSLYNGSSDQEWLKDLYLTFPVGVTVNSATNFIGGTGGDMIPNLTSGSGITVHWNGTDASNWGVVHDGETATATLSVTIAPGTSGNLSLPYQINGDIYGTEPHTLVGELVLNQNFIPLAWLDLETTAGTVSPGASDLINVLYDSSSLSPGTYNANILVESNDPLSPQGTVSVLLEVIRPNGAPVIDLPDNLSFGRNDQLTEDFSPYISDPDNDPLTLSYSGNTNIDMQIEGLQVTFSSLDGWVGSEVITFTVDDGLLDASDTITIEFSNTAPWINLPESISFGRNSSQDLNLEPYGGDDDGDGLELTFSGNSNILVELNGLIATFSAPNGWVGSETITFTVDDGVDTSSDAVLVTVTNSAPIINLPTAWSFDQDTIGTHDLTVYVSDSEGDELVYNYSGNTNIVLDLTDGILTASPVPGWYGSEIITITVSDGYLQASDTWEIAIEQVISSLDTPIVTINLVAGDCILDWQDVPNASYYIVYGSPDPYGIYTELGQSFDSQYQFITMPGMAFFKVKAVYEGETK
ncbi:MAG: S8 family serine peptidase [Candidatus Cloacimonadota bacterium]